jgi:NDP-sugar pyrophosphorylase family protein
MPETVIIPTAGTGSRMGSLVDRTHKCLLPYLSKPIIAHIIDAFPGDSRFVIPVGHMYWSVESILKAMYPDRNIEFVGIDNYKEEGSGTAYTLLKCQELVSGPFWYVACDTYFNESLPIGKLNNDTYFTKVVPESRTELYTMFKASGRTIDMSFKKRTDESWTAFTGLMYISDHRGFFSRLASRGSIEFIDSLSPLADLMPLETWKDMGNKDDYLAALREVEPYDFTKPDETTWVVNGKVLKEGKIWQHMLDRTRRAEKAPPHVVPEGVSFVDTMLVYDRVEGTTAYDAMTPDLLPRLLGWLRDHVWKPVPTGNFSESCMKFYRDKTRERVLGFVNSGTNSPVLNARSVNGKAVGNWSNYLSGINWKYLSEENRPAWIHGDLQFDNVIVKPNGDFRVIDWRPGFGLERYAGDIYYDLAKLLGGCIIDYSKIKKNQFSVANLGSGDYEISVPAPEIDNARATILEFTRSMNMDTKKVEMLVPLIFWNMAPLHTKPFDELLWCLGLLLFSEIGDA